MSSLLADELLASGFLEAGTISLPEIVYGADGTGIYSCNWDSSGHLTITLTDGRVFVSPSLTGPRGLTGSRGEPGEKGDTGEKGDPGPTGPAGPRGLTGPIGPQGQRGETGSQGAQGPAGPRGERGPQGIDGADGVSPEVQVTNISGGHRVAITDATHPTGQTFDVMDGQSELYVVNITSRAVPGSGGGGIPTFTLQWEFSATANEIAYAASHGKKVIGRRITSAASSSAIQEYSECLFGGIEDTDPVSVSFISIAPFRDIPYDGSVIATYTATGDSNIATEELVRLSGFSSLLVTFTQYNGVWSADKLFAEIENAIDNGAYVYATLSGTDAYYSLITFQSHGNVAFWSPDSSYNYLILLDDNTVYVDVDNYQSKSITDAGGYFTTDTVEGALQELGAELAGKADKTPRIAMTGTDTAPTLDPNKLYVFPEMSALTITLATPSDNTIVNEYHFIFDSGATATVLTLPASVLQPDGFTVEANMRYEISILEGCMTAQGWGVSVP